MEGEREEYRAIAERRVRLGLLLSEIGQANGIDISQQEMNGLIAQAAQQYRPADREKFIQYVRNEPMAAAQLRAPLFEDKVVDFLFARAEITDRTVTRPELEAEIEGEEGHVHGPGCGHDHSHDAAPAPKAKKAKGKKSEAAPAEEAPAAEAAPEEEAKPAKKPRAKKAAAAEAPAEAPAAEAAPAEKPAKKAPAKRAKKEA
jgi:trigger factor